VARSLVGLNAAEVIARILGKAPLSLFDPLIDAVALVALWWLRGSSPGARMRLRQNLHKEEGTDPQDMA